MYLSINNKRICTTLTFLLSGITTASVFFNLKMFFQIFDSSYYYSYYSSDLAMLTKKLSKPEFLDCHTATLAMSHDDDGLFAMTATIPPFKMNIHNPVKDKFISGTIQREGCWDCGRIAEVQRVLRQNPNSYFLDIGGNIGMYTLAMAAAGFDTYTLEPFPDNWKRICRTIEENGFHQRAHIINAAATNKPMNLSIDVAEIGNMGSAAIHGAEDNTTSQIIVQGVTIDSLMHKLPLDRPVVIKLDVEGAEFDALEGAKAFFERIELVYLLIELRTPMLKHDPRSMELMSMLASKGVKPYRLDDELELDVSKVRSTWQHTKHPYVKFFDVIWKKDR